MCGSDGVDYHNECLLRHAACVEESDIKVDHAGSCQEDGNPLNNDEGEKDEGSGAVPEYIVCCLTSQSQWQSAGPAPLAQLYRNAGLLVWLSMGEGGVR